MAKQLQGAFQPKWMSGDDLINFCMYHYTYIISICTTICTSFYSKRRGSELALRKLLGLQIRLVVVQTHASGLDPT
eukprot:2558260-Ditylum_brightwellii.AAC.1